MGNQKTIGVIRNGKVKRIYIYEPNWFYTIEEFKKQVGGTEIEEKTDCKKDQEEFKELLSKYKMLESDRKKLIKLFKEIKLWNC